MNKEKVVSDDWVQGEETVIVANIGMGSSGRECLVGTVCLSARAPVSGVQDQLWMGSIFP